MDARKREELLQEMRECFEDESVSEIRKGYYVIGLFVVLFDKRTIVLINIAIALGIGFGLNAIESNPWTIFISLIVNMLLVRFLLFGLLMKGVEEDQEEFRIQFAYMKELMERKKK